LFDPDSAVTREQFIKMLVDALKLSAEGAGAGFTDVDENEWYYNAVSIAQALGITGGYEDGSFGVGREITREEMAVLAYRAAQISGVALGELNGEIDWNDAGEISGYAYKAVSAMQKAGILTGLPGNVFLPAGNATRAQTAVMICRLIGVKEG